MILNFGQGKIHIRPDNNNKTISLFDSGTEGKMGIIPTNQSTDECTVMLKFENLEGLCGLAYYLNAMAAQWSHESYDQ